VVLLVAGSAVVAGVHMHHLVEGRMAVLVLVLDAVVAVLLRPLQLLPAVLRQWPEQPEGFLCL
jgi:hypothetical protein